ncbi:CGNR zinc finger domain-containing protein [Nocardioides cavernaquae]|uniref:Zf-CGNR multi-domain protein n=1 Tax=Nocardioides cavernaquae TaxID=2321396 RepID=A0A3A5HBH0_9ACTN|nr:CGNR zinc finger domain-containing protein [Nocardioides cavernaquae]RJS46765.1 zf-CGNR multi-domain protein [Nocardioides cavernaquae]
MRWPATTRYGLDPAPGPLAFVQDFLNSIAAGSPRRADLLADLASAQDWLDGALGVWSGARALPVDHVALGDADLGRLRNLRAELVDLVRGGKGDAVGDRPGMRVVQVPVALQVDGAGMVSSVPVGTGWRYVASVLLMEMQDAQRTDGWRRLKTCANHRCSAAFYDRSRNNSGVWHDGAVCGNAANLRAHRARRLAEGDAP